MCGLKIKPHTAKGSHAGLSPRRPQRPRSRAGAAPSPLSCKAATVSAAGQLLQAGSLGATSCFSPQRILHQALSSPRAGGDEVKAVAAWAGNLGKGKGGIGKLREERLDQLPRSGLCGPQQGMS